MRVTQARQVAEITPSCPRADGHMICKYKETQDDLRLLSSVAHLPTLILIEAFGLRLRTQTLLVAEAHAEAMGHLKARCKIVVLCVVFPLWKGRCTNAV